MAPQNTTDTIFEAGWVDSPNGRGTLDILWSCLLTIFVCTWTILHLNLPAPNDRLGTVILRKARWMLITVVFPEILTASAYVQRKAARDSVQTMAALNHKWTLRQAFYLNMGGLWLKPLRDDAFPINAAQLNYLVAEGALEMPNVSDKEIGDKSKADKFAKLVACAQITWLILQCIGRRMQNLPITPLEIAAMGFAVPSLATYILWFHKPADVCVPMTHYINESTDDLLARLFPKEMSISWTSTPLDRVVQLNKPSFTSEVIIRSSRWPGREAYTGPAQRIRNDGFDLKYSKWDQFFVSMVWSAYAAIHFLAWNFEFPSRVEVLLWRVASVVMLSSMFSFWIAGNRKSFLVVGYLWPGMKAKMEKISDERTKVSMPQILLGVLCGLLYLAARFYLIVAVFTCFRKLPKGAFDSMSWTNFFPHV